MEIIPWKPFGGLGLLRREMDRVWDQFGTDAPLFRTFEKEWAPSIDLSETKDNFVVKADLPGIEAKDVNIHISGEILTIKGEKKAEKEEKDEHYHRVERCSGAFQRIFQLPSSVKTDKVDATFDKGVLKITLPKVEEAKKKEIDIKVK